MAAVRPREAQAPDGYEWTETDWASDAPDAYTRSKVDTERLINAAADASDGRWDAITMNPAMICGPILFKAQVGQWIEQIGRLAACPPAAILGPAGGIPVAGLESVAFGAASARVGTGR